MTFECEETMLLSLQTLNGENSTLVIPNLERIEIYEDPDKKTCIIQFPISIESEGITEGMNLMAVYFDVTNDPTPNMASTLVSLGYYTLRCALRDCKIISLNPLTVVAKKTSDFDTANVRFTRPLRRVTT